MKKVSTLGCMLLIGLACVCRADTELPADARGFSGQVRGVVAGSGEEGAVHFRVGRVLRVWTGNKADNPESLIGKTVRVTPRWVQSDGGQWRPNELHQAFLRKLREGQELTLEIANVEGPTNCQIMELTGEQREWARRDGEGAREESRARERVRDVDRNSERTGDDRRGRDERVDREAGRDRPREGRDGDRIEAELREIREELQRLRQENAELRRRIERR